MDELNKKLAEFAEFQWFKATDGDYHWFDKEGNIVSPTDEKGNVIWDMTACLKWLVPNFVNYPDYTLDLVLFRQASGRYYAEWRIYKETNQVKCGEMVASDWQEGIDVDKITALALCRAIEKLIDKEETNEGNNPTNPRA